MRVRLVVSTTEPGFDFICPVSSEEMTFDEFKDADAKKLSEALGRAVYPMILRLQMDAKAHQTEEEEIEKEKGE